MNAGMANAVTSGFAGGLAGSDGHLKAGIIGAASAAAFYQVGTWTDMHNPTMDVVGKPNYYENILGHAIVGCASAAASGGDCGKGALSAAVSDAFSPMYSKGDLGVAEAAVVGGTASVIGGGKFAAGAITAAWAEMYNAHGATNANPPAAAAGAPSGYTDPAFTEKLDFAIGAVGAVWDALNPPCACNEGMPPLFGMGDLGQTVSAGQDLELVFKTSHYADRLIGVGLNVSRVESSVAATIQEMSSGVSSMAEAADIRGRLFVENVLVEFRAQVRAGIVRIGTIFPVK
jgi:hypothetical protein